MEMFVESRPVNKLALEPLLTNFGEMRLNPTNLLLTKKCLPTQYLAEITRRQLRCQCVIHLP